MRQTVAIAGALAATATAQSASSITFWMPGFANNLSQASKHGLPTTSYPPVASIITSNPSTTVFALGCPSSTGTPSSMYNGAWYETCNYATDLRTFTIISSTKHIMHVTREQPSASMWWSCDYNTAATKITCDLEITGDVNDNTDGVIEGAVWGKESDRLGNVLAWATAEVVTAGRFGELECGGGYGTSSGLPCNSDGTGGKGTRSFGVFTESTSARPTRTATGPRSETAIATASQGSGSGGAATAASTASGSAATGTTGAAGGFGVDAVKLAALVGGAAFAAW